MIQHTYLLQHLLSKSAALFPDHDAVIYKENRLTYADLEQQSNRCAHFLKTIGIQRGERVGIMLEKSVESIISLFGILKADAVYVPLDNTAPQTRIAQIMNHCEIRTIITSARGRKKIEENPPDAPYPKTLIVTGHTENNVETIHFNVHYWDTMPSDISEEISSVSSDVNPAYILHTSGSTGVPKGVVISHRNALTFIDMAAAYFSIQSGDRICNHAPLHFDLSVFDIFTAIKTGATIILLPEHLSTFPVKLAEFIENEKISVWNSVASVLTILADRGRLDRYSFENLRLIHFSGDIMPVKYLRRLKQYMPRTEMYNIYGQTEANSSLCYHIDDVSNDEAWKIPIGKPFPNFEVFALKDNHTPLTAEGDEGELYVNAGTVALGYWNDTVRTQEKFVPDPRNPQLDYRVYRTGDRVRLDSRGNFLFTGRRDHLIKSKGYRIELGEIEAVIGNHPAVQMAAAIAISDELIGNRIKVIFSLVEGMDVDDKELFGCCAGALPHYMIPESIERCNAIPLTASGKIDRKELEKRYGR